MLSAIGLEKSFGKQKVLNGVSLKVNEGDVTAIIGPSGSGKSTLLRCLIYLEKVDNGTILIEDKTLVKDGIYAPEKEIPLICAKMGMVFQHFNLFPHMNVMGNMISAPMLVKKRSQSSCQEQAMRLLQKVGLQDKTEAMPLLLSGGEKQRLAIARALMMEPAILLFDEPTSALDPELTGEVLDTIKSLAAEHMTMIVVTHEMSFAREVAGHIVFMAEGEIVEQGPPQIIFSHPRQERTRTFLEKIL